MNLKINLWLRNKLKIDSGNKITIHPNASVKGCKITIKGKGNYLQIDEQCNLRNMNIEILGDECIVHIGSRTTNTGICKISCREKKTSITIGSDCLLANNVMILTSDGHDIYQDNIRINHAADVIINNHVWLAENVMVLKGVHIEDDCVIGANSVVTGQHEKIPLRQETLQKQLKKIYHGMKVSPISMAKMKLNYQYCS